MVNLPTPDLRLLLGELEWSAVSEFNDISDYIYKAPRLLVHEKDLGKRKLAAYFPNGGVTAAIRSRLESVKLDETFPRLIAMANLFLLLSIFENYIFNLLRILQDQDPAGPKPKMGWGVAAHLTALKVYGAKPHAAEFYEQVLTAVYVRNCLMHSRGLLATFRQADALRARVTNRTFLDPARKKIHSPREEASLSYEVTIEGTGLGEQLVITNSYAHLTCAYLRDYFCALCGTLNPNTALRPVPQYLDPKDLSLGRDYKGPIT